MTEQSAKQIVIFDAPKDQKWTEELLKCLEVSGLRHLVWTKDQIAPGDDPKTAISRAIESAKVAILLISVDFFVCPDVAQTAFPLLLQRHPENIRLFCIPVSPIPPGAARPKLAALKPAGLMSWDRPLSDMSPSKRKKKLGDICDQVHKYLFPGSQASERQTGGIGNNETTVDGESGTETKRIEVRVSKGKQGVQLWIALVLFLVCLSLLTVLLFARPRVLAQYQVFIVVLIGALCAGFGAFFLTGNLQLRGNLLLRSKSTRVKASGGFALMILVLSWWGELQMSGLQRPTTCSQATILLARADELKEEDKPGVALARYQEAETFAKSPSCTAENLHALVGQGDCHRLAQELRDALIKYDVVITLAAQQPKPAPKNIKRWVAYALIGRAHIKMETKLELRDALEDIKEAEKIFAQDDLRGRALALSAKARAYLRERDIPRAKGVLSLLNAPDGEFKGELYLKLNPRERAYVSLRRAEVARSDTQLNLNQRSDSAIGHYEQAIEDLKDSPNSDLAYTIRTHLGWLWAERAETADTVEDKQAYCEKAAQALAEGGDVSEVDNRLTYFRRQLAAGRVSSCLGRPDEALRTWAETLTKVKPFAENNQPADYENLQFQIVRGWLLLFLSLGEIEEVELACMPGLSSARKLELRSALEPARDHLAKLKELLESISEAAGLEGGTLKVNQSRAETYFQLVNDKLR